MSEHEIKHIKFAPGVLEDLEDSCSPEELQNLMDEIKSAVQSGSIFSDATPVDLDELMEEDPELYDILMSRMEELENIKSTEQPKIH